MKRWLDGDPVVAAVEFTVGCVQGDVRPGGDGVEADAERAIGGFDVDRSVAIAALGEGMADQVEKEPEGVVFERAELREASTPAFGQTAAGACQLVGLVMGEPLEMGLFCGAIDDRWRGATAGVDTPGAQAWGQPDRSALEPARARYFCSH